MKIDSLCLCLCFSLSGVLAEMSDKGRHLGEWHTPLGFHGEQLAWIRLPIEAGQRDFFSSSLSTLARTRQSSVPVCPPCAQRWVLAHFVFSGRKP